MLQTPSNFTTGRKALPLSWRCRGWLLLVLLAGPQLLRAQAPRAAAQARLAPGLQAALGARGLQAVRVRVADPAAFRRWVQQHLPAAQVSQPGASPRTLEVRGLSAAAVSQLATAAPVDFVDVTDRQAHEERQLNNSDLSVNAIAAVHARFPQLAGQGLAVSVKELPFDPNDIDFIGRVINPTAFPAPFSDHATAMATLIGGAGNSSPLGRGVARQVRLTTSDFARLLPDDGAQLAAAGVSVQNHSYGVAIENYYGIESLEYDRQVRQYPTLLHVFSSGNVGSAASPSGPYTGLAGVANVTGQFKMSKNTLTVGATDPSGQVASLSSRGPAYDGRLKPELVAYGEGGSSEAAALVSGIGVLLQQAYRDQHSGALPPAALVKAVLLNSADDLGRPEVDFVSGYGQADALGALTTMRGGQFFSGSVAQGAEQVFIVSVPAGQQFKATLVWNDPEAAANAAKALVNDLDLELVSTSTGQRWQPWALSSTPRLDSLTLPARRRPDHLNNVEQITLAVPTAGTYELHVRGFAVPQGPQAFSLAYETSPTALEWRSPQRAVNVRPGAATPLLWYWNGPATATGRLEYRPVGRAQWRAVSAAVPLAPNRYAWTVPDTTALAQLRFVVGSQNFTSDTFAIVQAPAVQVGYTCPEETLLQWRRVPGATGYQVYRLGATTLVPLAQPSADTALVFNQAQMAQTRYYAVAPLLRGVIVQPGSTIDFATQGTACYFRSFLPRQLVDESIRFDVELGTVFRLRSATLERMGSAGFEAVQTIAPLTAARFSFIDRPPAAGRYLYRVRLDNVAGRQFYSGTEEAYLLGSGQLQAYPNPVPAGAPLTVVANSATPVVIRLYDMLGRFQRTATAAGQINVIETEGLKPGLYLLQVQQDDVPKQTLRVVIQ
ncbi:S8 family serine peptidase [Hymenobacter armeniacus]|uniref:S8 family serine peptidase n=1 Tax=Hymenobacter armeniacus TaxID=2771358 RepID=A0ABR8JYI7_9BACT|nr:S8 family serine peptidase [Hymenobacter armeniacus]MBD2723918.1 S8 family serine peptidase [Hymenobacter armeniacus]